MQKSVRFQPPFDILPHYLTILRFKQVLFANAHNKVNHIGFFCSKKSGPVKLHKQMYPIFTYIYAIWYYQTTGKKSLSQSAAAAGKLFGIDTMNKSTVSRNIKAMEHFIEISQIDRLLPTDEPEAPSDEEVIERIPEILGSGASVESLERRYGQRIKRLPEPIRHTGTEQDILSAIPGELSQVVKDGEPAKKKTRDVRKRPGRPRGKGSRRAQRQPDFVDIAQIEKTRRAFIEICRSMVVNAAAVYHRFLI